MKAFVTGASGFTGSHLVRYLERRGDEVVGLVRPSSDLSRLSDCNPELVRGDLSDRSTLETAMKGAGVVFHTAAYVELGLVNEAEMERVNVEGTRAVLEAARAAGAPKVVYCSTIGVFGDTGGQVVDETFERRQNGFSSPYDRTKLEAQQIVDRFAAEGVPVVSVLPSGILGPDDPHFGAIVKLFLSGWLKFWPGSDRFTGIVHVDDLVEAMVLAAEAGKPGDRYIISAGDMSLGQMFELLGRETGIPSPREAPEPLVRALANLLDPLGRLLSWQPPLSRERVHYIYDRGVRVDASKARRELGWNPRPPEAILRELLEEYRE